MFIIPTGTMISYANLADTCQSRFGGQICIIDPSIYPTEQLPLDYFSLFAQRFVRFVEGAVID